MRRVFIGFVGLLLLAMIVGLSLFSPQLDSSETPIATREWSAVPSLTPFMNPFPFGSRIEDIPEANMYIHNYSTPSIPDDLWSRDELEVLTLRNLNEIPAKIGQLSNLRFLNLSHNSFNSLPPELFTLTNLEELYLSSNQLSSLPPEIDNLVNLQVLVLSYNQLESV